MPTATRYAAHATDAVYERDTLEEAIKAAVNASHRTGETATVFIGTEMFCEVSAHNVHGKATIRLRP